MVDKTTKPWYNPAQWFREECKAYGLDPRATTPLELDLVRYNARGVKMAGVIWRNREWFHRKIALKEKYGDGSDIFFERMAPIYADVMDNLSPTFRKIIHTIAEGRGNPVGVGEIKRKTGLSSVEVSAILKKLREEGIVCRERSGQDRRRASYVISDPDFYGFHAIMADAAFLEWKNKQPEDEFDGLLESGHCVQTFLESVRVEPEQSAA